MKKILFGPLNYFSKKLYIKGVLWLIFIIGCIPTNVVIALLFWLLSGWLGNRANPVAKLPKTALESKSHSSEPVAKESKSNYITQEFDAEFPETDEKGMKLLRILDHVKLSGVTREHDGVNPQDTIASLFVGEEVFFRRIPIKKYPNATMVVDCNGAPIGWIPEGFSYQEDIAKRLDDGTTVKGQVSEILGGEDSKNYGIRIDIARYEKKRVKRSKMIMLPLLLCASLLLFGCGTPTNNSSANALPVSASSQPETQSQANASASNNQNQIVEATDEEDASGPTGTGLLAGVYHPTRFDIIKDSLTVTGTVQGVKREKDGDYHINIKPDPQYEQYINDKNISREHGCMVVEVIPADQDKVLIPKVNQRVQITGVYVLDKPHGWKEIHPAKEIKVLQ